MSSANAFNMDWSKILSFGKELIYSGDPVINPSTVTCGLYAPYTLHFFAGNAPICPSKNCKTALKGKTEFVENSLKMDFVNKL